jgi:hypothetical protein
MGWKMLKLLIIAMFLSVISYSQVKSPNLKEILHQADSLTTLELSGRIKELLSIDTSLLIPRIPKKKTVADKILDYLFMETNIISEDAIVVPEDIENILRIIEESTILILLKVYSK